MSITVPTAPRVQSKTVRKSLPVPLTDEEVKAKTDQMVSDMTELEKMETEFSDLKKKWAANIKELKSGINKARKIVATRTEQKLVEDATQIYDLDKKRTWIEYRGQEFDNMAMSEFELKQLINPPMFPDHVESEEKKEEAEDTNTPFWDTDRKAALVDAKNAAEEAKEASGEDGHEDGLKLDPLPPNVSEIEAVRRSETKKTRRDHTA